MCLGLFVSVLFALLLFISGILRHIYIWWFSFAHYPRRALSTVVLLQPGTSLVLARGCVDAEAEAAVSPAGSVANLCWC